jgi:hypothetical protein
MRHSRRTPDPLADHVKPGQAGALGVGLPEPKPERRQRQRRSFDEDPSPAISSAATSDWIGRPRRPVLLEANPEAAPGH